MTDEAAQRDPIDVLADLFVERYRQGERPTIEQFAQEHTEYADDIRDLFPMIMKIERLKDTRFRSGGGRATLGAARIEQLGDFRIIREIGRGGMGIVYEAEQESLRRRVALKVLGKNIAGSERQVGRFKREAEAAARLHHTNIVPVYGVGRDKDLHFYAMQLIDGVGLDAVLDAIIRSGTNHSAPVAFSASSPHSTAALRHVCAVEAANSLLGIDTAAPKRQRMFAGAGETLPVAASNLRVAGEAPTNDKISSQYWKNVARLGFDLAGALEYAHHHGILHRDIKPSNLLLDREGNVWITDYGLAKHAENGRSRNSGDLIGTLRYMAPEQFTGWVDVRSDVYSLGLTLYELLTLRPAFSESKQSELIRRKTHGPAPNARAIHPRVPRDLSAIVAKACATQPAQRYQTAAALAADLKRFLDERPVAARPAGVAERCWKWYCRNPAMAFASLASAALLLTVIAVTAIGTIKTTRAARKASQAQQRAENAQSRAESNLNLAIEAFEDIFDSVTRRGVPQSLELDFGEETSPRFETVLTQADAELAHKLLVFYEQFARQNSSDVKLRGATATANFRIGEIQQRLGDLKKAEASYREALRLNDGLLQHSPHRVDYVIERARILNAMGILLQASMRPMHEVVAEHQKAAVFLMGQPANLAKDQSLRLELARSHELAGSVLFRSANFVIDPPDRKPSDHSDTAHQERATVSSNMGGAAPDPAEQLAASPEFIESELNQSHTILNQLMSEDPRSADLRLALVRVERNRFIHALVNEELDRATESFHSARKILEKLIQDFPREPQCVVELADTLSLAGNVPMAEPDAEEYLAQAIKLCSQLTTAFPGVPEYQALLAASYRNLARVEINRGHLRDADRHLDQAKEKLEQLLLRYPDHAYYSIRLASAMVESAETKRLRAEKESNREHLAAAQQILERAIARFTPDTSARNDPYRSRTATTLYSDLAEILNLQGNKSAAAEALRRAKQMSPPPKSSTSSN